MKKTDNDNKKNKKGVAALLTIVIIAAAVLVMAYTASILGLGELEMGYTMQKAGGAFSLADACMEEALIKLRFDSSYSGENLNIDDGSCIIGVTGSGSDRTVISESSIDNYYKKIQAQITISGDDIIIDSWQEVEN
ncbi:MAG TPA: hypothetical protein VKP03_03125 [Patescibacteria group bacterium]|nr:hypothetical protein [Patescibacteria group bacterium]